MLHSPQSPRVEVALDSRDELKRVMLDRPRFSPGHADHRLQSLEHRLRNGQAKPYALVLDLCDWRQDAGESVESLLRIPNVIASHIVTRAGVRAHSLADLLREETVRQGALDRAQDELKMAATPTPAQLAAVEEACVAYQHVAEQLLLEVRRRRYGVQRERPVALVR